MGRKERTTAFAVASALVLVTATMGVASTSSHADDGRATLLSGLDAALAPDDVDPGTRVSSVLSAIALAEGLDVPPAPTRCPTAEAGLALHLERLAGAPVEPWALPGLAPALDRAIGCLLLGVHHLNVALDATMGDVPIEDVLPVLTGERQTTPGTDALLANGDHRHNLVAAIHAAELLARALPALKAAALDGATVPRLDLAPVLLLEPAGPAADTLHTDNYALTIDLGGNDVYDNHAGGVFLAWGDSIWDVEPGTAWHESTTLGQNVAVAGNVQDANNVASSMLLVDLAGDDTYGVKHPPMLADARRNCAGEDLVGIVATIGGGVIGTGMAFDLAGDNTYVGRTSTQGGGHVLGVGVLYTGPGTDAFEAVRLAQGSGLLGGVGVLVDEGGDSRYTMHMPPRGVFNGDLGFCDEGIRYAQGSAFDRRVGPLLPSVGILADRGGNDLYDADALSQGFGQGPGMGLLLDEAGDDNYLALTRSQGAAQGRSRELNPQATWGGGAGILVDRLGNDRYEASDRSQGWAAGEASPPPPPTSNIGVLLNWALDHDEALGLLYDEAGDDTYAGMAGRADGAHATDGLLGLFADAPLEGASSDTAQEEGSF